MKSLSTLDNYQLLMFIIFTQVETILFAFFFFLIEGGTCKDKIGCLSSSYHDLSWEGGRFGSFSIQEAKSPSSIWGQPRLHFAKLSGKLSCPLLKEKQIPTDMCSCKQLLISIIHSLRRLIQTLLPTPVRGK